MAQNSCLTDYLTATNNISSRKIKMLRVIISAVRRTSWPWAQMQFSDGLSAFRHSRLSRYPLLSDRSLLYIHTRYKNEKRDFKPYV